MGLKLAIPRLSVLRKREITASVAFTGRLRRRFERLNLLTLKGGERAQYDLGEIHEIFKTYSARLNVVFSHEAADRKRLRSALREIQVELYTHLPYHLRMLRKTLDTLIDELEKPKPRRRPRRA